jgi:hypothetical protein
MEQTTMDRTIQTGFAEQHFVTHPDHVVACMEEPAALFCGSMLTLEHLAAWIGRLPPPPVGVFARWFGAPEPEKGPDEADALKALREIVQCGKPSKPLPLPYPLLVLAPAIEKTALAALLVIKMRGYCQTLVLTGPHETLDVSTLRTSLIQGSSHAPEPLVNLPDCDLSGFGPIQGLRIVCGMTATVFSTESDCEEILKRHPALAQTGPPPER